MIPIMEQRQQLLSFYQAALSAIGGRPAVSRALLAKHIESVDQPLHVVAVGKAAQAMLLGALDTQSARQVRALLISKYGHIEEAELAAAKKRVQAADGSLELEIIESAHPVPDENSLLAGERLHAFLADAPANGQWRMLVSGGASALVESLPEGMSLNDLKALNQWLLGSGLAIGEINQIRQGLSRCKAGQWLPLARAKSMQVLLVSDVQGDDPALIGSGLFVPQSAGSTSKQSADQLPAGLAKFWRAPLQVADQLADCDYSVEVVASLDIALAAIESAARGDIAPIHNHGASLFGSVEKAVDHVLATVENSAGLHIWGGELTPELPPNPGRGGRCQQFALALAQRIQGRTDLVAMVVSTDGGDGNSDAAGAMVDGSTVARANGLDAAEHLAAANSEALLAEAGDLIYSGPTGSNVTDLTVIWRTAS